jgi:flagellar M-ring protein FliF
MSAEGLPTSGRIGFEIFDRTQFGATEFMEQVNLRRALEGEIARTIATIAEIASARVHIAMAKESLFQTQQQPAKASVIVKLRYANRPLAPATVAGIASLVASAVEGLRPEHVVVMDSFGRPLSQPGTDASEPLGSAEIERQQRFERDLGTRVAALLEPVVGRDRVRVNVAARLNPDTEDRVEEQWDPNTVVRSRSVTQENGSATSGAGGVAGARANVPGPVPPGSNTPAAQTLAQAAPVVPVPTPVRSSETTNFEIGKVVRHTIRPRGDVSRISVAVILDDDHVAKKNKDGKIAYVSQPRNPAEIQKIHGLVAAAVGLDPSRGDQLTVENISFDEPIVEDVPAPGFIERFGGGFKEFGRVAVVLILGLVAVLAVGRPLLQRGLSTRGKTTVEEVPPKQLPKTIQELEGEIEAQLDAQLSARLPDRRMPVLTKRLTGLAEKEPESAARLVRTWLLEDRKS